MSLLNETHKRACERKVCVELDYGYSDDDGVSEQEA